MTQRGLNGPKRKPRGPGRRIKPGHNSQNGEVFRRGPDLLPRKQMVATMQMVALGQTQWRDPKTGRLTRSRKAVQVRGAAMQDMIRAYVRATYALGHDERIEPSALVNGVVKLGDHFGQHLDDKPAAGQRVTKIILSTDEPSQEVPPDTGRRRLGASTPAPTPAEEGYVEVREEDLP